MSTDQPFNELGQLLSSGFDLAVGLAISNQYPISRVFNIIDKYASGMNPDNIAIALGIASAGVTAGNALNDMQGGDLIPFDDLPTNPYMGGESRGSARGLISVDFSIDEGEHWYRIDSLLPDAISWADWFADLQSEARRRIKTSPLAFGLSNTDDIPPVELKIRFGEKAF